MARMLLVIALMLVALPAGAQSSQPLEAFAPVSGEISSGQTQQWNFSAEEGDVVSFSVETISGDLDPVLEIASSTGELLLANDDYDFPASGDALLQAVTLPRSDTYRVTVSGFGESAGEYRLTVFNGFGRLALSENFDVAAEWRAENEDLLWVIEAGRLTLALEGVQQSALASNAEQRTFADYYAQVAVDVTANRGGWSVGMSARQQDGDSYYLLNINDLGQWRFLLNLAEETRILRDWTPHPAIIAGETAFTLGIMARGSGFDFFYDENFIGNVADGTLTDAGQIGLSIGTGTSLDSATTAEFDDLTVTTPVEAGESLLLPTQLIHSNPNRTAQDLRRAGLIPADGEIGLLVPESFIDSIRPGVNRFLLGGGVTFDTFALGTTVTWTTSAEGQAGCGLVLRAADETHYTLAFLDQSGAYGLARRDGDDFLPGIFGEFESLAEGSHNLLVIAQQDQLLYYVDGQYVGMLESPATEGEIGNAVVNFEPISTSCQFRDTWVWRWG